MLFHDKDHPDELTAALVLCERCGVDPKLLGYSGQPQPLPPPPPKLEAKPFVLRDPKTLTKRDWIYGTQLIRKFGSATFAPSGSGKSNLMIVEALAIATGRPLLGILPPKRAGSGTGTARIRMDELERRIGAACLHYGITAEELDGWLFVNSGRDPGSAVVIAKQERDGITIAVPVVEALVATIRANKIDVVMIDPFISSHQVPENDNNAIDAVAKTWTMIADVTNTAIDLAHHTRKTGGAAVTVEDGRGASALLSAVRPARVLNVMTEDEAAKAADRRRPPALFQGRGRQEQSGAAARQARLVPLGKHLPRQRRPERSERQGRRHGRGHGLGMAGPDEGRDHRGLRKGGGDHPGRRNGGATSRPRTGWGSPSPGHWGGRTSRR